MSAGEIFVIFKIWRLVTVRGASIGAYAKMPAHCARAELAERGAVARFFLWEVIVGGKGYGIPAS